MHDELPVDIFRRIVAFSTTSRSILDLWRLNESAQHQVSKEVKKLSKKAPIRLDIQRFFRENNPFELEFYEIGDAEQKRRFHEKIRELARLLEQILEISGEFQIDNLTAEALGFQAEHDEQFMDRAPFMLQKKMMYILSKFNSSEISISTVFMRPSRVIRTFRNRFDTITALDLGNVKALSSLNLRSKVFPALVNLEKLAWSHANHTYLRKIPNKEKLRVLDVTCHIVGRPEWREFEFLQEFTNLERFYLGFTVPNKPTRFEMDILLNLYQSIWKFKMAPKNEQLLRNLPKIKELGFWNSPEKIFQLISKHSLSIDTLTFGSLSQNMTKLCSFDSILDSFFKFEQAEDLQPPEIGHLNMNLHAMPAVGLDYYLPNVMNYVNKLPCLKSVSLFVRCIFHAQMTSSWSLESNREKSSRRRPIFESNYTHFTFHSEGLCGLEDLDRQLPPSLESCTISLNLPPTRAGQKALQSVLKFISKLGSINDFPELVEFRVQILGVKCFEALTNAIHDSLGAHLTSISILATPQNVEKSAAKRLIREMPEFFPKARKFVISPEFLRLLIQDPSGADWQEKIRKLGRKAGFSMEKLILSTGNVEMAGSDGGRFVPRGEEPIDLLREDVENSEEEEEEEEVREDVEEYDDEDDVEDEEEDEMENTTIVYEEEEDELDGLERLLKKECDRRHKKYEKKQKRIAIEDDDDEDVENQNPEDEDDDDVVDWDKLDEEEEEEEDDEGHGNENGLFDDEAEEGEEEESDEDEEEEPEGEDLADSDDERLFISGPVSKKRRVAEQAKSAKRRKIIVSDDEDDD